MRGGLRRRSGAGDGGDEGQPFDRLRANGTAKRAYGAVGELGIRRGWSWGYLARGQPLWIPAFAGIVDVR